jgi:large subunit ribosomal protein L4
MAKVALFNTKGENLGEVDLSDDVFAVEVNEALIHEAVVAHQANQRVGTSDTKTRGEVAGGGRKPWRQKGTGRARVGSIRSPIWRKGGVTFGPHPRAYVVAMNRKARRAALRSALSSKLKSGVLVLVDGISLEEAKTREMVGILANLKVDGNHTLVVTAGSDEKVLRATGNIPGVATLRAADINVYDVLRHNYLVLTREAADVITEVLTR